MGFECGHSTGKLSTGTRQEHICVSQNEERSLCAKGRDAAERRGQVHVQLQDRREDVAALLMRKQQQALCKEQAGERMERLSPKNRSCSQEVHSKMSAKEMEGQCSTKV